MNLTKRLDDLVRKATSPVVTQQGAKAMADEMRRAAATVMGPDLRLSNFRGGSAQIKPEARTGEAAVTITGPAFALADKGRRRAARRVTPRRAEALSTPYGPRAHVRGSTSRGAQIVKRNADRVLEAGKRAVTAEWKQAL